MKYALIPKATVEWLQNHAENRDVFAASLVEISEVPGLDRSVLAAGALRVAVSPASDLLIAWNTDYLSSSGADDWAVFKLEGPFGLLSDPKLTADVFLRMLSVTSRRLRDLVLPTQYIHRRHGENLHTCVAGGNDEARKVSIAYFDGSVHVGNTSRTVVFCIGPNDYSKYLESAFDEILAQLRVEVPRLSQLISEAEDCLTTALQRPSLDAAILKKLSDKFTPDSGRRVEVDGPVAPVPQLKQGVPLAETRKTQTLSYGDWLQPTSPLTSEQRSILTSDTILRQPVRIVGPAGSGKTLLMQLIAVRMLMLAKERKQPCHVLYVVHSNAMATMVWNRFDTLGIDAFLDVTSPQRLEIQTLSDFSRSRLGSEDVPVIDKDASETKEYQREVALEALRGALEAAAELSNESAPLLFQVKRDRNLQELFAELFVSEIGVAIKGHQLTHDARRYIESEVPLSRLHKELKQAERAVVFDAFRSYNKTVFEDMGVLDSDDLAISLVAQLRAPLWEMRRRKEGVDFLFVDETHLFNENERRIFSLITKPPMPNLPIALALDQAQDLRGTTVSGFGRLGIDSIADEQLTKVYRSTKDILKLAFHMIQQTTDLFSAEFPDFTGGAVSIIPDDHPLVAPPELRIGGTTEIGTYVLKQVKTLRTAKMKQIGVVVYGTRYWEDVRRALANSTNRVRILSRRGEVVDNDGPMVVLTRPDVVGGQEFDAVIVVGIESGIVPPRVETQGGLVASLEQQSLRSLYLSFTRARYRLVLVNSAISTVSPLLQSALRANLIKRV